MPADCQWTIIFSTYGYVLRHEAQVASTLVPTDLSTSADAQITVERPKSLSTSYIWTLENVSFSIQNRVVFYDRESKELTFDPIRYIDLGESKTCAGLKLYASFVSQYTNCQNLTWSASDPAVVTLDASTGKVTGMKAGDFTVITASATYNDNVYSETYDLHITSIPDGIYFLENKAGEKCASLYDSFVEGATIQQWYYQDADHQKWVFTHRGDGTYTIRTDTDSVEMYMGVADNSSTNGANVVLRSGPIEDGMIWTIVPMPNSLYKLIPKSSGLSNMALAVNAASTSENGVVLQQLSYVNDTIYNDEWYICPQIDIGMSTDDSSSGECHSGLSATYYASSFYNGLYLGGTKAPVTCEHHYNTVLSATASKADFAENGAISNEIDFMVYMGHGHKTHGDYDSASELRGNHLHYDCGILGTPHELTENINCNPAGNVYTTDVHFGSSVSDLRWVWLYTCNFLTTEDGVSNDALKEMMNGAHILMGYASQSYLCTPNVEKFAAYLRNGETIIRSFFKAGHEGEAPGASDNHLQKVLYIPQAIQETIYSPRVHYEYDTEDVLIEWHYIDSEYT